MTSETDIKDSRAQCRDNAFMILINFTADDDSTAQAVTAVAWALLALSDSERQ